MKRILISFLIVLVAITAAIANVLRPSTAEPVVAIASTSVTARPITAGDTGGCAEVTITITAEPDNGVQSLYLLIAETKRTSTRDKIVSGDPIRRNYIINPAYWHFVGVVGTPLNAQGEQNWYLEWTNSVDGLPVGTTDFSFIYCGDRDLSVQRNSILLASDLDGDPSTEIIGTLDSHTPFGS